MARWEGTETMANPKLATSRPAALTGTLGQGGVNRPHDVAIVQALLGAKRDKRARPYLQGKVTGKCDKDTAAALLRYRMDMRDGNIKRPLNARGPMLNRLAQSQSLAVLEGTTTPYSYKPMAEAGPVKGVNAKDLSAERKVALKQVMKEITRNWGIAFDVEVTQAPGNDYALVARFTPRNLSVHIARGLSAAPSNAQFRARAKALYVAVEADLMARCTTAFGIKDLVDVKIQQGLKDDLACVVRMSWKGLRHSSNSILAAFRDFGLALPVRLLEHYLGASGSSIQVSRDEALQFGLIRNAVEVNIERFKERNFIAPNPNNPAFSAIEDITKNPAARVSGFQDHWKRDIDRNSVVGAIKIAVRGFSDLGGTIEVLLGPGSSSLTSSGDFLLRRQGDQVLVTGTIMHLFTDPGFNFNPGRILHEEAQILQRHGKARPFTWTAEWREEVVGVLQIENIFQPDAARRWISFETRPDA